MTDQSQQPTEQVTSHPLVVAVLLNWRKPLMTARCVQNVLASQYPNAKVIVVDNGSGDDSVTILRDRFPQIEIVESDTNLGFSRGCNIGIRRALELHAAYVAIVNNDLLLEPEALGAAVTRMEQNSQLGAVTGKIYAADEGIIWQAGGHISHLRVMGRPRGHFQRDEGQFDQPGLTKWASGAMSLFRAGALRDIELFPEEYFFGQEEWDWSTNLRRHGYFIGYEPTFVGRHTHGSSYSPHPALNSYGATRNRLLYAEKYLPAPMYHLWRLVFVVYLRLWIHRKLVARATHSSPDIHARAMLLGWRRHSRHRPVTRRELYEASVELGIDPSWVSPSN